jgi:hypothetical protein
MFVLITALIAAYAVHVLFERPVTRHLQDAIASVFSAKRSARV